MIFHRFQNQMRATLVVSSLVMLLGTSRPAHGVILGIQDGNASASIDVDSQRGLYDWYTDGVNIAPAAGGGINDYRQWFWYGVGANAPASVDSLTRTTAGTSDANFNGTNDTAFVRYFGTGFKLEVTFSLVGGTPGSGVSDIGEQIRITNTNLTGNLDFHFYQYGDFQLTPPFIGGEHAWFTNTNTVHETGALGALQETIVTPPASHREVAKFADTINKLNNGINPVTLSDTNNMTGDVTWAYEWDVTIAPGATLLISKDMQIIIPEPGSFALVLVGIAGLCVLRRRRS
jgi:hypothetical protein